MLIYDLETSANLAYVWGKYEQNVIEFEHEWELLCFAYKWLGEKKTQVIGQDDYTEKEVVEQLHALFEEADVVIAHNGDKFDQRKSNAKFIEFGLMPPAPYKSIDTLKVARKYFSFNSNKLDDLGKTLGLGRKLQTGGFATWLGCVNGDPKSWQKMKLYNKQDVILLEQVYYKLRPWIDNHPADLDRPESCPKCAKGPMQARGYRSTKTNRYARYQCQNCWGWSSARTSVKTEVLYTN